MKTLPACDRYLAVEGALEAHLADCAACSSHQTCNEAFVLLREESAAWTAGSW
jgi:hypothetical protein